MNYTLIRTSVVVVLIVLVGQFATIQWVRIQHQKSLAVVEATAKRVELVREENRIMIQNNLDRIEVRLNRIEELLDE